MLAEAIAAMIGVPIGLPVPHIADGAGRKRSCTVCGRPSPPNKRRCQDCGEAVEVVEGPPDEAPASDLPARTRRAQ